MRCLLYYIWIAYLLDFRLVCARLWDLTKFPNGVCSMVAFLMKAKASVWLVGLYSIWDRCCWMYLVCSSSLIEKHWFRIEFVSACVKRHISYFVFEGMDLSHKLGVLCSLLLSCKLWCRLMLAMITSKTREQRAITYLKDCWHSEFRESNRQSVTSIIFYQAAIHLSQNFLLYWCSWLVCTSMVNCRYSVLVLPDKPFRANTLWEPWLSLSNPVVASTLA